MGNPISGPVPIDEFRALVNAPAGQAEKLIRKYDPLWHRAPGEKIKWRVTLSRKVRETGIAYVMAASEKEADKLAGNLKDSDIDWDTEDYPDEGDVESIEAVS